MRHNMQLMHDYFTCGLYLIAQSFTEKEFAQQILELVGN